MMQTESKPINEYIDNQTSQFKLSTKIGLFTLFNGKKWYIYIFIAVFPILISWISGEYLFGNPNAKEAFIDMYVGFFYIFMFTFGALLISLPVSSDEISDNVIDLYLVRPINRDTYWTSRWVVVNIGVFIINWAIVTFYWLYFILVDNGISDIVGIFDDILATGLLYIKMLILVFFATITYSGLFLLVGSIGNRAFTIGILLALTETFFISLLFLEGSSYIPRTHLNQLAYDVYKNDFSPSLGVYESLQNMKSDFSTAYALTYLIIFSIVTYLLGMLYFRRKEFS